MKKLFILLSLLLLTGCMNSNINNDNIEDTPGNDNVDIGPSIDDGNSDNNNTTDNDIPSTDNGNTDSTDKENNNSNTGDIVDTPEAPPVVIEDKYTKALWWWNKSLDNTYFEFAINNDINEIYYCDSAFDDNTKSFIKKCKDNNIKVYLLTGDYSWITNSTGLYNLIEKYQQFQISSEYKFDGIHLDIEPHQDPSFSTNRLDLVTKLINLVYDLKSYNIEFHYDIPFWLDDLVTIDGIEKKAHEWIIDYADKVIIMSYRDTKDAILNVASDEYIYANSVNKEIMISVETYSTEGDFVSFYEEGKKELNNVIDSLFYDKIDGISGIAIHHIKSWYDLKEE